MCRILSVSRSGFYRWLKGRSSRRSQANAQLMEQILRIFQDSHRTYGSPRMTIALRQQGICCNQKRVARLMRLNGWVSKIKRRFRCTTRSGQQPSVADHLVREVMVKASDRLWRSDITYLWTREGWLYLAVFLDAFSRRVVGWAMSHRLTDQLVLDAFSQALTNRRPGAGLIAHSDRGSQYCSQSFQQLLRQFGFRQSMSATGNCYDNALVESFFGTLKTELIYHETYRNRDEARRSVFKYIEMFYNRVRIHSAIGGFSPNQFEQLQRVA